MVRLQSGGVNVADRLEYCSMGCLKGIRRVKRRVTTRISVEAISHFKTCTNHPRPSVNTGHRLIVLCIVSWLSLDREGTDYQDEMNGRVDSR